MGVTGRKKESSGATRLDWTSATWRPLICKRIVRLRPDRPGQTIRYKRRKDPHRASSNLRRPIRSIQWLFTFNH